MHEGDRGEGEAVPAEPMPPDVGPDTEAEAARPPGRASLLPLPRVALYLAACVVGAFIGLVPTGILTAVWFGLRGDRLTPDALMREPGVFLTSALLGIYPTLVLVTTLFVRFVDRGRMAEIGLVKERWAREAGAGLLLGVGFIGVTTLVYLAFGWVRLRPLPASAAVWLVLPLLSLVIGFTEELIFRGYLLQRLDEGRGRRVAIAVTTVLFWLVHLGGGNVHEPLGAAGMLAIGLTLALCRYATGSLWLPIGFHAAYDWGAIGLGGAQELGLPAFYRTEVLVPPWLVGPPGDVGVMDLVFLLILLTGVYSRLYRPRRGRPSGDGAAG
jgi:membrane protease YdiL (CAAX protease family)